MRRPLVAAAIVLLVSAFGFAGDGTSYGEGVTLEDAVAIPALLADPQPRVGQTIRVDGVVTGVCKKRGCWMQVTDPDSGEGLRVKVEDGVIVFPYSAMGHRASVQGVFEAIPVEPAPAAKHEHEGEGCDRSAAEAEPRTGCDPEKHGNVVYLLRGTGAVVHD